MILFELRCAGQHHFEAWFKDGAAYDAQAAAGAITCPVCGDCGVEKAPMAPRLVKGRGDVPDGQTGAGEVRKALLALKKKVQESCDYVGGRFPEEARKIHYGDSEARAIYGEASPEEARDLADEGVSVQRLPWVAEGN